MNKKIDSGKKKNISNWLQTQTSDWGVYGNTAEQNADSSNVYIIDISHIIQSYSHFDEIIQIEFFSFVQKNSLQISEYYRNLQ